MNGAVRIGPELAKLWDDLKLAAGQAIVSLPSVPSAEDLVKISTQGNLLSGETVVVEATPALQEIVGTMVEKLKAFTTQK